MSLGSILDINFKQVMIKSITFFVLAIEHKETTYMYCLF